MLHCRFLYGSPEKVAVSLMIQSTPMECFLHSKVTFLIKMSI